MRYAPLGRKQISKKAKYYCKKEFVEIENCVVLLSVSPMLIKFNQKFIKIMLQSIKLNHLRSGEFIQFYTDVISICDQANSEELGIKLQVDDLKKKVKTLNNGYGKERGSDITIELSEIDSRRDNCITGIRAVADAYSLHYNNDFAEAANHLITKIDSYGGRIAKQNYQAETTILNNLCDAFEQVKELKEALQKLHLSAWAKTLKQENQLFNQRFIDRINESAQQNEEKFKELRDQVNDAYRIFCNHISAHVTLKGIEGYAAIVDPLNSLIENYNLTIKRRIQPVDEVVE